MPRLDELDREWMRTAISECAEETIVPQITNSLSQTIKSAIDAAITSALEPLAEQIEGLHSRLAEKDKQIDDLQLQLTKFTSINKDLRQQSIDQSEANEQYSRKDSLRISGVPIQADEDNEMLRQALIAKLSEKGVDIDERDINRAHRCSKPQPMKDFVAFINKKNTTPTAISADDNRRTAEILVKFTNWNARANVYKLHHTKNVDVRVRCDLTKRRLEVLSLARDHLRDNNHNGYAYNNAECGLVLVDSATQKRERFATWKEFSNIVKNVSKK